MTPTEEIARTRLEKLGCHPKAIDECFRWEPNGTIILLAVQYASMWYGDEALKSFAEPYKGWPNKWWVPEYRTEAIPFVSRLWRLHNENDSALLAEIDRRTLRRWLAYARDRQKTATQWLVQSWLSENRRLPMVPA